MGETQWEDDAGKRGQVDIHFFLPRVMHFFFAAQVDILFWPRLI